MEAAESLADRPELRADKAGDPRALLRGRGDVPALEGTDDAGELPPDASGDLLLAEPILENMASIAIGWVTAHR